VAFVIDTGRSKEKSYDPHLKTSTLQESWISQASAKQRRGRAGRCKAGVCFHLFSKQRHSSMRPFVESELIRTPLEEICLQCKRLNLAPGGPEEQTGIPTFLSKAMTPPHPKSVLNALELLVDLGAMDAETNELTDLGWCLSALSLEPRVGKMVIMSNLLGCTKSSTAMATAMSYKSPFALPPPSMRKIADQAKIRLSNGSESDQITSLNVLKQRDVMLKRGSLFGWCRENFLNFSSINMISDLRKNASRELESLGFPPSSEDGFHNRNENCLHLAFYQAAICAGLYPNIAFRRSGEINFSTVSNKKAKVHLSSVNAVKPQPLSTKCQVAENEVEFILFGELVKGKNMFTMDHTSHLVSSLPLILFCGDLRVRPHEESKAILSIDDWLVFICDSDIAASLVVLRKRLDSIFASMTRDPSNYRHALTPEQTDAVQALDQVLKYAIQTAQRGQVRTTK
jgi:ATP-dependent RNA helicase DHX36